MSIVRPYTKEELSQMAREIYANELENDGFRLRAEEVRQGYGIGSVEQRIFKAIETALSWRTGQ